MAVTSTAMTCRVAKKGPLAVMTALVAFIHVKASHRLDGRNGYGHDVSYDRAATIVKAAT